MVRAPRSLACALLLSGAAAAQEPADGGWRWADGVAAQAGDQLITTDELLRYVEQRSRQAGVEIRSPDDLARYLRDAVSPNVLARLQTQAGEDLGIDPLRVERAVRLTLDERRRELGPQRYNDFLEAEGVGAIAMGARQSDLIYRQAWVGKQLGYDNAGTERPVRDRFLRPGELRAIYRTNLDSFAEPALVRFQDLVVPTAALGNDVERTRENVAGLRQRALAGEPFDDMVEANTFSNRESLGKTDWLEARRLSDDGLRRFALEAPIGSYSEVMPIAERGKTVAFRVVKLLERREAATPPGFEDETLQRRMREVYASRRDKEVLERAQAGLLDRSYVWHAPGWEPPAPETRPAPPGS